MNLALPNETRAENGQTLATFGKTAPVNTCVPSNLIANERADAAP
jgi:hypothetical protein